MKFVRQNHGAIIVGECLFIVAGLNSSSSNYLVECETFDHQTNLTNASIGSLNVARSNFGICHSLDKK